jgi:hypothetical protein
MPPSRKMARGTLNLPLGLEEVIGRPASPAVQLKEEFCSWFREKYGETFYWGAREAGQGKQCLLRAGEAGVEGVMAKVHATSQQAWVKGRVTIGLVLGAWNSVDVNTRKTLSPDELARWAVEQMQREREEGE